MTLTKISTHNQLEAVAALKVTRPNLIQARTESRKIEQTILCLVILLFYIHCRFMMSFDFAF